MTNLELVEKAQVLQLNEPQLILITVPGKLSELGKDVICDQWEELVAGTKLEGIPVGIMDSGKDIKVLDLKKQESIA